MSAVAEKTQQDSQPPWSWMLVSQFRPPRLRQSTEAGRPRSSMSSRGMMVEFRGMVVAVGAEPGGPTGMVRFETAMLVHIMGSKVSVTVSGTVVPPRPWVTAVVFLGPGPGVGTLRGGPVDCTDGGGVDVDARDRGNDRWVGLWAVSESVRRERLKADGGI